MGLCDFDPDTFADESCCRLVAQSFFILIQNHFSVSFGVTHELLMVIPRFLTVVKADYPRKLLSANVMVISGVGIEKVCHIATALFHVLSRHFLPFSGHCSRPGVELRNVQNWEFVFLD